MRQHLTSWTVTLTVGGPDNEVSSNTSVISAVAGMSSGLRQGHIMPAFGELKEGFQEDTPVLTLTNKQTSARRGSMVQLYTHEVHLGM